MNYKEDKIEFNKGVMKLSAYDPLLKRYETRILTLPELPSLEPLEHMFNTNYKPTVKSEKITHTKPLRLTKSCNSKRSVTHYQHLKTAIENYYQGCIGSSNMSPRRCRSNPDLSIKHRLSFRKKNKINNSGRCNHPKRPLSNPFHAVAELIQKANKKIRSSEQRQKSWSNELWITDSRTSSDSLQSNLDLKHSNRKTIALSATSENWWNLSPPVSSF